MSSVPSPRMSPLEAMKPALEIDCNDRLPMSIKSALTVRLPVPVVGLMLYGAKGFRGSCGAKGPAKGVPITTCDAVRFTAASAASTPPLAIVRLAIALRSTAPRNEMFPVRVRESQPDERNVPA